MKNPGHGRRWMPSSFARSLSVTVRPSAVISFICSPAAAQEGVIQDCPMLRESSALGPLTCPKSHPIVSLTSYPIDWVARRVAFHAKSVYIAETPGAMWAKHRTDTF